MNFESLFAGDYNETGVYDYNALVKWSFACFLMGVGCLGEGNGLIHERGDESKTGKEFT